MAEEIFPLVDQDGNVIGQAPRSVCHDGSKLLHPVIHLHIFNSEGNLYLQKRADTKDIQPGKWDSSVAGHIDLGEAPEVAALREAGEELGLSNIVPQFITKYIIETDTEIELSYCFYAIYDGDFTIDEVEVSDGRFWSVDEIEQNMDKDIFTINFKSDFNSFLRELFSSIVVKTL